MFDLPAIEPTALDVTHASAHELRYILNEASYEWSRYITEFRDRSPARETYVAEIMAIPQHPHDPPSTPQQRFAKAEREQAEALSRVARMERAVRAFDHAARGEACAQDYIDRYEQWASSGRDPNKVPSWSVPLGSGFTQIGFEPILDREINPKRLNAAIDNLTHERGRYADEAALFTRYASAYVEMMVARSDLDDAGAQLDLHFDGPSSVQPHFLWRAQPHAPVLNAALAHLVRGLRNGYVILMRTHDALMNFSHKRDAVSRPANGTSAPGNGSPATDYDETDNDPLTHV